MNKKCADLNASIAKYVICKSSEKTAIVTVVFIVDTKSSLVPCENLINAIKQVLFQ